MSELTKSIWIDAPPEVVVAHGGDPGADASCERPMQSLIE